MKGFLSRIFTRRRRRRGFDGNCFGIFLFDFQDLRECRRENEKSRKFFQIGMNLFRTVRRQGDILEETNHSIPIETSTGRFNEMIDFFENLRTIETIRRQTIDNQLTNFRSKTSRMNSKTRIDDRWGFTMNWNQSTRTSRRRQHFTKETIFVSTTILFYRCREDLLRFLLLTIISVVLRRDRRDVTRQHGRNRCRGSRRFLHSF